jgi:Dolichyl-phosphate-mannose-protein mannosyltransferase
VVASVVIRSMLAFRDPSPWIFQDELLYSELAKSFASTGHFAIRESPGAGGFGVVYPMLISPAWALFKRVPTAYDAAKAINALVMSLAAVPVYFLARRVVDPLHAFIAAVLTLALPAMVYTTTIMTENAFFPAFLLWALTAVLALERPTVLRQLAAVGTILLAYLTRNQAAVLAPALVTAILLLVLLEAWGSDQPFFSALPRRLAAFWVSWVALIGGGLLFLAVQIGIRGQSLTGAILGGYSTLTTSTYSAKAVSRWFVYHLAELDIASGVIPFAAFLFVVALALRPRPLTPATRAFAAVAVSAALWLLVEVAAFASTGYGGHLQERNLFVLEPLFLIALLVWVGQGLSQAGRLAGVAAIVAAALPGVVSFSSFLTPDATYNALGLLPLQRFAEAFVTPDRLAVFVMIGAAVAASVFLVLPRRFALVAPLLVLAYFAVATGAVEGKTGLASLGARMGAVSLHRDWIDRAVGAKPQVADLWTNDREFVSLWVNEFFNRSVGPVYNFYGPADGLPQETVTADTRTGIVRDPQGRAVRTKYVLLSTNIAILGGRRVATDPDVGLALYETNGPIRYAGRFDGLYHDSWSGATPSYSGRACHGGTLTVLLTGDPILHPTPVTIVASSGDHEVGRLVVKPPRVKRPFTVPFTVPVVSRGNLCKVSYAISPTAQPALVLRNGDTRELGMRFTRVIYRPD